MTAPQSPYSGTVAGPAQPFEVRLGDSAGSDPTPADAQTLYQVLAVTRSAGGHRLDHAELQYNLADAQQRIMDLQTPQNVSVQCQIHTVKPQATDQTSAGCVHRGEIGLGQIRIDRREELRLMSRIEPYHFGDPLLGPKILGLDNTTILQPHTRIVFQPEIDGRIMDNMLVSSGTPTADWDDYALWVDPEGVRTATAVGAKAQIPNPWTLVRAVHSICWACNPDETFVKNPTYLELQTIFARNNPLTERSEADAEDTDDSDRPEGTNDTAPDPDEPPELRNVELPRGKRLHEYLDLLLPRFGYSWFLEPTAEQPLDGSSNPDESAAPIVRNHIRIFRLGEGQEVSLYLQRPNNPAPALDVSKSNVPDLGAEWNWADTANEIVCHGSPVEWEATFELYRGWTEDEDAYTADELRIVDDGADESDEESVFKDHPNAWRKYVLNEAGDYCGTRVTVQPIPEAPFDLSPLLGPNTEAKRRRFHRCLTIDRNLERREVYLQYRDATVASDGDAAAWKTIPREGADAWTFAGFHVLEKECGIYFSGSTPPPNLMDPDICKDGRLRITATIRGDDRLEYVAQKRATEDTVYENGTSPNRNTIRLFVDLSDRFHYRNILKENLTGFGPTIYASALQAETYGDDTTDDTKLIEEFGDGLRDIETPARISCDIELAGIQTAYQIGQLVKSIDGRNISLNRNNEADSQKLYPQITQIVYDRVRQRTRLTVETYNFAASKLGKLMF